MAGPLSFDSNIFYRFTLNYSSSASGVSNISLDGDNNGLPNGYANLALAYTGAYSGQYWQITTHGSGYQLCSLWLGPDYRLGYYTANSTYYPALFTGMSRDSPSLQWNITLVDDSRGGIFTVANIETSLVLDVAGNIIFLGNEAYGDYWAWLITPIELINNASYTPISTSTGAASPTRSLTSSPSSTGSATITESNSSPISAFTSTTPSSSSSPSSPSSSSKISTAAAAGIGVGVGVAVLAVLCIILWSFFRRRKNRQNVDTTTGRDKVGTSQTIRSENGKLAPMANKGYVPVSYDDPHSVREEAGFRQEIDGTPVGELPISTYGYGTGTGTRTQDARASELE